MRLSKTEIETIVNGLESVALIIKADFIEKNAHPIRWQGTLMKIRLHPHAQDRLHERGTTEEEVVETIERGERFPAKHGRTGFRCNFPFDGEWNNRRYSAKQVEAYAVEEEVWFLMREGTL